jgi:hypothetical protein
MPNQDQHEKKLSTESSESTRKFVAEPFVPALSSKLMTNNDAEDDEDDNLIYLDYANDISSPSEDRWGGSSHTGLLDTNAILHSLLRAQVPGSLRNSDLEDQKSRYVHFTSTPFNSLRLLLRSPIAT